jgi:hypothetical protein
MQPNDDAQTAQPPSHPSTQASPAQPLGFPARLVTHEVTAPRPRKRTSLLATVGDAIVRSKLAQRATPTLRVLLTRVSEVALRLRAGLRHNRTRP